MPVQRDQVGDLCGDACIERARRVWALSYYCETGRTKPGFADDLQAISDEESCTASHIRTLLADLVAILMGEGVVDWDTDSFDISLHFLRTR